MESGTLEATSGKAKESCAVDANEMTVRNGIIRAISDKADQSDMMDYPVFEVQAAQHSIRLVYALLGELKN